MQLTTYLSFRGECEAAFRFYGECLDGKLGADLPLRRVTHGRPGPG